MATAVAVRRAESDAASIDPLTQVAPVACDCDESNAEASMNPLRAARRFNMRLRPVLRVVIRTTVRALTWLWTSRERTNYTYDLTPLNVRYLGAFVAAVADIAVPEAEGYIDELHRDRRLAEHVAQASVHHADADSKARYGRRAGWYALVRALKPQVVVETGVDKGLGSVVLAAALLRNRSEGHDGQYWGVDISSEAGWLFTGRYAMAGEIVHQDSHAFLEQFSQRIDLLICDADHTPGFERTEYQLAEPNLGARSVVLSDTAHHDGSLFDYATITGRRFLYFQETPRDHWYRGAGIGAAWTARTASARRLDAPTST